MKEFQRIDRISEEVRRELDAIIREEMNDPRMEATWSITRAEVTGDLRYAKIYVSVLEDDKREKLLEALKREGAKRMVATSKPQPFSEQILAHFGFAFDAVHGVDFDGRLGKADMIRLCMAESGAECVMVGDTEHDARGAAEAGVPFIGVHYGFGDSAEMAKYPMAGPADSPADVLRMLMEGHYI